MSINELKLAKELIRKPSVTPKDAGAINLLARNLRSLGFKCQIINFKNIKNLYAKLGKSKPNFCYAGHTDVVPPGNINDWSVNPFKPSVKNNKLIGRGANDMKASIACFIAAVSRFKIKNKKFKGSISLLITGDEEGLAINGTKKVVKYLKRKREKINFCLVGEPTNPNKLGEMIKIGRRGSITGRLSVIGTQGHVAYPQLADNPIPKLILILNELIKEPLDEGNEYFDASNLEITSIDAGNSASNVIPPEITAKLNIRYNDNFTKEKIESEIESRLKKHDYEYSINFEHSGDSFITEPGEFVNNLSKIVEKHCKITPTLSTTGGTSDARFIKNYGRVVEFGLVGASMHKINEYSNNDTTEGDAIL